MIESAWQRVLTATRPWDVVVIGAGPAGALAARQLAIEDRRVLLVEKHRLPRPKVCGGCLGGAALNVLDHVGLTELPAQCGAVRLQTMRLANGGHVVEFPAGRRMAVERQRFDALLVEDAQQAGAAVCDNTFGELLPAQSAKRRHVRLLHQGCEHILDANVVMIASGLSLIPEECRGIVAPRSYIGLGAIVRLSLNRQQRQTLSMACAADGYVGVAAVGADLLDIAAAVSPNSLTKVAAPGELVGRLITSAGLEAPAGLDSAHWRGTPPLTRRVIPLVANRCVLIGDAAGYVEPFTGEGIGWALQSAVEAAAFVHDQLEHWNEPAVARWRRRYAAALHRRHRRCRIVASALRSAPVRSTAIWALQCMPSLASPLVHRLDKPFEPLNAKRMELLYGG